MSDHNYYLAWQLLRRELKQAAEFYEKETKKMIDQSIEAEEWQRREYQYLVGLYNERISHNKCTEARMDEIMKQVETDETEP